MRRLNTARAALIVSVLACVGAWGGPALARTLITGHDIAPNSITGRNVKNLSGRDVVANGLDGSDIDEQSLDQVPSAKHANGANHVNGVDFLRFQYADPAGAKQTLLDRSGLTITASCDDGNLVATATSSVHTALVRVAVTTPTVATTVQADSDFGAGDTVDLLPAKLNDASGTLTYAYNGTTGTITYLAQDGLPHSRGPACVIGGSAVFSKP